MYITGIDQMSTNSASSKDIEAIDKSGIIDRRRVIHIFYDATRPLSCKVIQINISTTKTNSLIFDDIVMNRHNGTLSFVMVYVYECKLNTVGKTLKEQFRHGTLTMLTARQLDRETDFDRHVTANDTAQFYSKVFDNYRLSEYVDSKTLMDPRYYTQNHEYFRNGDFNPNGLREDIYALNLVGDDIIDDCTEIYQQNINSFATVRDTLLLSDNETLFGRDDDILSQASNIITDVNFVTGYDTMLNGGVFAYDSLTNSMNFDKVSFINKKYIAKETLVNELNTFMTSIQVAAEKMKKFGNIRLMYAPSLVGSKCRIVFLDHNNAISDSNSTNTITSSKSSKDSSYETTEYIGEIIDANPHQFIHRSEFEYDGIDYPFPEKERRLVNQM